MRRRFRLLAAAAVAIFTTTSALAAPPLHADICDHGRVDKQRLAIFALDSAGVSRNPERWAQEHPEGFEAMTPLQRVIADTEICVTPGTSGGGAPKCAQGDAGKILLAFATVQNLLQQPHAYRNEGGAASPGDFFANPNAQLICLTDVAGAEIPVVEQNIPQPNVSGSPLRIRALADDLRLERRDTTFGGLERASISFKDDNEAGKESIKITAIVGWAVIDQIGLQLVPYAGLNLDRSRKDGQATDTTTNILRFGVLSRHRIRDDGGAHVIVLRPEYARNRVEGSEVISANIGYWPRFNGVVNDAIMIRSRGRPFFSLIPRLEARVSGGHFVSTGSRLPENGHDFLRVGGQLGFSLLSDMDWLPAEFTVTETYLHALAGNPGHLSQLRAVLSITFDKAKYFSFDLSYVRGRREDLAPREDAWSAGLSARF